MIAVGQKVKDTCTEFEGIVARVDSPPNIRVRVLVVASKLKDGRPNEVWFDEARLAVMAGE